MAQLYRFPTSEGAAARTGTLPGTGTRPPGSGLDDGRRALEADYRRRRARAARARARRRRRARIRRNRLVVLTWMALVSILGYVVAGLASGGGPGRAVRRTPTFVDVAGPGFSVPGHLRLALPWPAAGEGAVGVEGAGVMAASPRQRVVPIASMTKMMTALVVLGDHPLAAGTAGPVATMTRADVNRWVLDSQAGDSTVPVQAGERLSEYQLLEGLLMPSGDNIAEFLARWDAGSVARFVEKMNVTAHLLGLRHTHYADPSGVDPASRSTPADQVVVASALMGNPVARAIVGQRSVPFPVAGTLTNYNPLLGTDGVVGVKSGFTHAAAGCLAVAALRRVGGHVVTLVSVVTGSPGALYGAATEDRALLAGELRGLRSFQPAAATRKIAVRVGGATRRVSLKFMAPLPRLVLWRGAQLGSSVHVRAAELGQAPVTGQLVLRSGGSDLGQVRVLLSPAGGA